MKGAVCGLDCALITDGRFSGGTHVFFVGHVAPEAAAGGPVAFVEGVAVIPGEVTVIPSEALSSRAKSLSSRAKSRDLAKRCKNWKLPEPRYISGFLAKYAKLAQGAEVGAITNF